MSAAGVSGANGVGLAIAAARGIADGYGMARACVPGQADVADIAAAMAAAADTGEPRVIEAHFDTPLFQAFEVLCEWQRARTAQREALAKLKNILASIE
jgi:hypothetical protein